MNINFSGVHSLLKITLLQFERYQYYLWTDGSGIQKHLISAFGSYIFA